MSARRNLTDEKFGRLTVLCDSGKRTKKGEVVWTCRCECGCLHHASTGNIVGGSIRSCGCLQRELSSLRRRAARKPARLCQDPGCTETIEKGAGGFCGKHAQRIRRHGDPGYVTPFEVWRSNNRNAQLQRFPTVKPATYRKLFGRHEHRAVAEAMLGRRLRSDEHVHHKDENKQNNLPGNLEVLPAREHLALHAAQRRR
jgi:hypothetical protein